MSYRPIVCVECGVTVEPMTGNQIRCRSCGRVANIKRTTDARAKAAGRVAGIVVCLGCGEAGPRRGSFQSYCKPCAREQRRIIGRTHSAAARAKRAGTEAQRARARDDERRRRARLRGVEVVPYRSLDIYDRDGWVCHICSEPMDPTIKHPNPMSPSIDHVIPICLAGPDTPDNVRAAHLVCNTRRGWRGALRSSEEMSARAS